MMEYNTFFILESTYNPKFPYRINIRKGDEILLRLWVQDKWPTDGRKIFCIREIPGADSENFQEIERVPVLVLNQYGKKLILILDRPINKRCEFLFLKKKYKNKEGEYEVIFWMTQKSLEEKRPTVRLNTLRLENIEIIIDNREKYPYKFPGSLVKRDRLPAGDYALVLENKIVAIVERKRFHDLVDKLTNIAELNLKLAELKPYQFKALVIESDYSDFLRPEKLRIISGNFGAKLIGELFAYHPDIQIVFARNRKLANEWVVRYFAAINAILHQKKPEIVSDIITKYDQPPLSGDSYFEIKNFIVKNFKDEFSKNDIKKSFPDVEKKAIIRAINSLIREGLVERIGFNKFIVKNKEGL